MHPSPEPMRLPQPVAVVLAAAALWLGLTFDTTVSAQARVDVEVKDASGRLASGRVTLSAGNVSQSCSTVGGRCSVTLAAGRYQAVLAASSGATATSQVTVPSTGSIRLSLRLPAAPASPPPVTPAPSNPTTTSKEAPATTTQGARAATPTPAVRNLSRGSRLLIQGSIFDASGRLTNATITVEQNGRVVGNATCVGGRFSVYDLPSGKYAVVATAANGRRTKALVTLKSGSLLRPTLRLPAR